MASTLVKNWTMDYKKMVARYLKRNIEIMLEHVVGEKSYGEIGAKRKLSRQRICQCALSAGRRLHAMTPEQRRTELAPHEYKGDIKAFCESAAK